MQQILTSFHEALLGFALTWVLQPFSWFLEFLLRQFSLYVVVDADVVDVSAGTRAWGLLVYHYADVTPGPEYFLHVLHSLPFRTSPNAIPISLVNAFSSLGCYIPQSLIF